MVNIGWKELATSPELKAKEFGRRGKPYARGFPLFLRLHWETDLWFMAWDGSNVDAD
jgi:hypothetical protein